MVLRIKYKKIGDMKYLSHLELMKTFQRAFRRMNIPLEYTKGFSPTPKISFASPLLVGIESISEYMDVEIKEAIDINNILDTQKEILPRGLEIIEIKEVEKTKSLMSLVYMSDYDIIVDYQKVLEKKKNLDNDYNKLYNLIEKNIVKFITQEEIIIERFNKKKNKFVKKDIKSFIKKFNLNDNKTNIYNENKYKQVNNMNDKRIYTILVYSASLTTGSVGNLKPKDLIKAFHDYIGIETEFYKENYLRNKLYIKE